MSETRILNLLNPQPVDDTVDPHPEMWQYFGDGDQTTCLSDDDDSSGISQQNQWYPVGASTVNPSVAGVWGPFTATDVETAQDLLNQVTVIGGTFHLRYSLPQWEDMDTNPVFSSGIQGNGPSLSFNPQPLQLSPDSEIWDLEVPINADSIQFGMPSTNTMTALFTGASPQHDDVNSQYLNLNQDGSDDTGNTTILWFEAWWEIEYEYAETPPPPTFEPNLTADLGEIRQTFSNT